MSETKQIDWFDTLHTPKHPLEVTEKDGAMFAGMTNEAPSKRTLFGLLNIGARELTNLLYIGVAYDQTAVFESLTVEVAFVPAADLLASIKEGLRLSLSLENTSIDLAPGELSDRGLEFVFEEPVKLSSRDPFLVDVTTQPEAVKLLRSSDAVVRVHINGTATRRQ